MNAVGYGIIVNNQTGPRAGDRPRARGRGRYDRSAVPGCGSVQRSAAGSSRWRPTDWMPRATSPFRIDRRCGRPSALRPPSRVPAVSSLLQPEGLPHPIGRRLPDDHRLVGVVCRSGGRRDPHARGERLFERRAVVRGLELDPYPASPPRHRVDGDAARGRQIGPCKGFQLVLGLVAKRTGQQIGLRIERCIGGELRVPNAVVLSKPVADDRPPLNDRSRSPAGTVQVHLEELNVVPWE